MMSFTLLHLNCFWYLYVEYNASHAAALSAPRGAIVNGAAQTQRLRSHRRYDAQIGFF